jgi:hypothetical protein
LLSISRFIEQVRKDGTGVLPIMSTDRLCDDLSRRSTQLLNARGLDGGRSLGTLKEGQTSNQMGRAGYTMKAYSLQL